MSDPGLRRRIITPAPPAPVPAQRKAKARTKLANDRSKLKVAPPDVPGLEALSAAAGAAAPVAVATEEPPADNGETSDTKVVSSTGSMAIATLLSRITGFLRNVLITATLGGAIASAFNIANTLPNLINEIVLGAVLSSLVIPVLTRAEKEDADKGEAFIRRLFTLSATLLSVVTIIALIAAPMLTRLNLGSEGKVNLSQATGFAYWLLPQIFFYGIFALFNAVLNNKELFKPGAWAPVVNNVIVLIVMCSYWLVPGELTPDQEVDPFNPQIMLLGIGTTIGVVAQALMLLPHIRHAGVSLKPLWGIDARLRQFGGMAIAIVVYVGISQFGYIVTARIASAADAAAPNIFQQAWLLLQVPYGIIGVTLLTAIMPRLSRNARDGDDRGVVRDLGIGSKLTYIALIPIVVFFTIFGTLIARALFAYGNFSDDAATILGWTLSFSAFTLLPYATVLLHLRVFYAREEAWTPTFIIGGITITRVILSLLAPVLAASPERVVILLGAANGFGFVAGAVIGGFLLRQKLGNLGTKDVLRTCAWALGASIAGGFIAFVLSTLIELFLGSAIEATGNFGLLLQLAIVGVVFLVVTGIVLSRSGLTEIAFLGRALSRLPVVGKYFHVAPVEESDSDYDYGSARTRAAATYIDDTFNATPIPPPMSAGIVRGPRLIPGAEVSDGAFRLLADHGSVPGARFWQAQEKATGRQVALTFVDTSTLLKDTQNSTASAREAAELVAARTLSLSKLSSPAIPDNIEVRSYRNGCLVITDWVPGSSLASVAAGSKSEIHPYAATYSMHPLIDATERTIVGIDNRARIRISTEGIAVLAFPAVLPTASHEQDLRSLRTALSLLVDAQTAPQDIHDLLTCELDQMPAAVMKALAPVEADPALTAEIERPLEISEDITPEPVAEPGFGRKGFSGTTTSLVLVVATILVIIAAIIAGYITSLINRGNDESPLNPAIISSAPSSTDDASALGNPVPLAKTAGFAFDDPTALMATDGNDNTSWNAMVESALMLTLESPQQLGGITIVSEGEQADIEVFGIPNGTSPELTISNLRLGNQLGKKTITESTSTISFTDNRSFSQVVVWVNDTATGTPVQIKEVTLKSRS